MHVDQTDAINQLRMKARGKRIVRAVGTVVLRSAFVALLPILYVLEPFWRIRLGSLANEGRIGHLSLNHELYLRRQRLNGRPGRTSYVIAGWSPANRQFMEMIKRAMPVIESRWLKHVMMAIEPLLARTRFHEPFPFRSLEHFEYSELPPALWLTTEEQAEGRRRLSEMGIGADDWYVCVHARDVRYLVDRTGFGDVSGDPYSSAPHIRDCSIENFYPAMRWIVEQGGYVLRFGSSVEQPLPDMGPRIIDYASRFRSDFMDVYLPAHNRFFFGSASGAHSAAYVFNAPVSAANWATYDNHPMGRRSLFMPKLLRHVTEDRHLTFPEIRDLGLFDPAPGDPRLRLRHNDQWQRDVGVVWEENSAAEILDQCKDMLDQADGVPPQPEARRLQNVYRNFYTGANNSPYAGRIGPRFALRHRQLIEPTVPGAAPQPPQA